MGSVSPVISVSATSGVYESVVPFMFAGSNALSIKEDADENEMVKIGGRAVNSERRG